MSPTELVVSIGGVNVSEISAASPVALGPPAGLFNRVLNPPQRAEVLHTGLLGPKEGGSGYAVGLIRDRWTDVFVKRNGRWQIAAGQGTRVAQQ